MKNKPVLDPDFMPLGLYMDDFLKDADKPVSVAVERENGNIDVFDTFLHTNEAYLSADMEYIERIVKFMLWSRGGWRIYICGDEAAYRYIKNIYSDNNARAFDKEIMEKVYGRKFEVCQLPIEEKPEKTEKSLGIGGFFNGCRIGIDVGASNRKVCGMVDGKTVYMATEPWQPMENSDPSYHINELVGSLKRAADRLPKVDAIGISTAGIYVNNETRVASLFKNVSDEDFKQKIRTIYPDVCSKIGKNIPIAVANDGDIAALTGSIKNKLRNVIAISLGSSVAGGYIDKNGNITGRLNEFAFLPLDMKKSGYDAWAGDGGCCVSYFSVEAVIRLGRKVGILPEYSEKSTKDLLRIIDDALSNHDPRAVAIFETMGCYLAHAVYTYLKFYEAEHIVIMGGISAGIGGEILINCFKKVLKDEYHHVKLKILLPAKEIRTNGQSFAAATLVKI